MMTQKNNKMKIKRNVLTEIAMIAIKEGIGLKIFTQKEEKIKEKAEYDVDHGSDHELILCLLML